MLTRQKDQKFVAFKTYVDQVVAYNPNITRLDCLNPVKSIKHNFTDFVSEKSIDVIWKEHLGLKYKHFFYSGGVRDSLNNLFYNFRNEKWSLPADVYPVYQMMANSNQVKYNGYKTLPDFKIEDALTSNFVLLTFPFMGREITEEEIGVLASWLKKDQSRTIVLDRVYDYKSNPIIQPLIDTNQVFVCYSLSKTFLSPNIMGITICPEYYSVVRLINAKEANSWDEGEAKRILSNKSFPQKQLNIFNKRWKSMNLPVIDSYLNVLEKPPGEFLSDNRLVVPAEVYNGDSNLSVVSCLHETNALDEFDKKEKYYVTVLSNFSRGFDKYSLKYSKDNIPESTFADRFFLLDNDQLEIGFNKARHLVKSNDSLVVIKTEVLNYELNPHARGSYIDRNWIKVVGVFDEHLNEVSVEDAYSKSLGLNDLMKWEDVLPRSVSVLPIAKSCQAKCSFCFSHSSISDEQNQGGLDLVNFDKICLSSKEKGANRLVITGGGEPTMMSHKKLLAIMEIGRKHFNKVVMITNGYELGHSENRKSILDDYRAAGLTVLSVSRHSNDNNQEIMSLETKSELITKEELGDLKLRWVCVIQKAGVSNEKKLADYLNWVTTTPSEEICFKELYVAATNESIYHSSSYNQWCRENQVSMSMVLEFLIKNKAVKISSLPWGSPVYELDWAGKKLKIAVYTEPSIYWERTKGICRSWNVMADGKCYANLETTESLVTI